MITTRRPLRGLSALLLLLSPGVGGQLLTLLHPCPAAVTAQAPPAVQGVEVVQMAGHSHAMSHAAPAAPTPPPDAHHHAAGTCDCLGSCHTPALVGAPQAQILVVTMVAQPAARAAWPAIESTVPSRPVDRLPPTTAPPSV